MSEGMNAHTLSQVLFAPQSVALIVKPEGEGVVAVDGLIVFRDN